MDALQRARSIIRAREESEESEKRESAEEDTSLFSLLSRNGTAESAAVRQLWDWLTTGALDALPSEVTGFRGELARYADRETLIDFVCAILAAVPGSLTAEERAEQFVAVLTPIIEEAALA